MGIILSNSSLTCFQEAWGMQGAFKMISLHGGRKAWQILTLLFPHNSAGWGISGEVCIVPNIYWVLLFLPAIPAQAPFSLAFLWSLNGPEVPPPLTWLSVSGDREAEEQCLVHS